jgi:hypothetical protein
MSALGLVIAPRVNARPDPRLTVSDPCDGRRPVGRKDLDVAREIVDTVDGAELFL